MFEIEKVLCFRRSKSSYACFSFKSKTRRIFADRTNWIAVIRLLSAARRALRFDNNKNNAQGANKWYHCVGEVDLSFHGRPSKNLLPF